MTFLYISEALEKIEAVLEQVPGGEWTKEKAKELMDTVAAHTGYEVMLEDEVWDSYVDNDTYKELDSEKDDLQEKVDELESERDELLGEVDGLKCDKDNLEDEKAELEKQMAAVEG